MGGGALPKRAPKARGARARRRYARALSQSTRVKCCTSGSKSAEMQESGEIVDTGAMLKEMALDCSASINNLGASHFPPPTFSAFARIHIIVRVYKGFRGSS